MADDRAPPGGKGIMPTVPIRGIRMKFAVLEGLLEAGEVTTRDVVETLFNLVSLHLDLVRALDPCLNIMFASSGCGQLYLHLGIWQASSSRVTGCE